MQSENFPKRLRLVRDMIAGDAGDGRIALTRRDEDQQGKPFTEQRRGNLGVVSRGTHLRAWRVEICDTYAFPWVGMVYQVESGPFGGKLVNPVESGWESHPDIPSRHAPEFLRAVE